MCVYHFTAMFFVCLSIIAFSICSHVYYECAPIFMAAIANLLLVPYPYPCFIPCTFGPCYICFAATGYVVIHEPFTVRSILLYLFMYRITFVFKSRFTLHDCSVFQPQHAFLLRYICFAATCNLVNHQLFAVRFYYCLCLYTV